MDYAAENCDTGAGCYEGFGPVSTNDTHGNESYEYNFDDIDYSVIAYQGEKKVASNVELWIKVKICVRLKGYFL